MPENLETVVGSLFEVFGLIGIAYLYGRRFKPDMTEVIRLAAGLLIPCLVFISILDSQANSSEVRSIVSGAVIQITVGLAVAGFALPRLGLRSQRELALPISFVNSANLPLPLLLANFGEEAFSLGLIYFLVTSSFVFTVGMVILHGPSRASAALREPVLWACAIAFVLKLGPWTPPEALLSLPRLAAKAAIPLMLILFGVALSRTRLQHWRPAVLTTLLRYGSGLIALAITLSVIHPTEMPRAVIILYAMLPSAVVTVVLTQKAGRNAETVASATLLTTVVSALMLPILLTWLAP